MRRHRQQAVKKTLKRDFVVANRGARNVMKKNFSAAAVRKVCILAQENQGRKDADVLLTTPDGTAQFMKGGPLSRGAAVSEVAGHKTYMFNAQEVLDFLDLNDDLFSNFIKV